MDCHAWCIKAGMTIEPEKMEVIFFLCSRPYPMLQGIRPLTIYLPDWGLNMYYTVAASDHVCYLGIHLDHKLSWDKHIAIIACDENQRHLEIATTTRQFSLGPQSRKLVPGLQCHMHPDADLWLPNLVQRAEETHQVTANCTKHGRPNHHRGFSEHAPGTIAPTDIHSPNSDMTRTSFDSGSHSATVASHILPSPSEARPTLVDGGG
jgi:hypothetical protein